MVGWPLTLFDVVWLSSCCVYDKFSNTSSLLLSQSFLTEKKAMRKPQFVCNLQSGFIFILFFLDQLGSFSVYFGLINVCLHLVCVDGSFEYTDSTGTDLHDFIIKTLRNPR